jgi:multimeric flavodoxin WrbA
MCVGCFKCIIESEQNCPHYKQTAVLKQAILDADLVILTSPVYVFDVSGSMKNLLDHFGYQWLSHRPEQSMFNKLGLSVVTAAGAGLNPTTKTLKTNLRWWGMKKVFSFKQAVMSKSVQELSPKVIRKIDKQAKMLAKKISKAYLNPESKPELLTRFYFGIMRMGKKGHPEWNAIDHAYWVKQGYFNRKPWEMDMSHGTMDA